MMGWEEKGREWDHPQRKRKVKFLVKDVMKEETEPDLGISGMVETVEGRTRVEPVPFDKPKKVRAGTSPRKKKVREPNVAETEPNRVLEVAGDQTKIESDSSVQVTESVKEAGPTKRRRKVTVLFREAPQSDNNAMLHLINGSETGANPIQHDSGLSKKPKKVIGRKPKPSVKEVKKEIELPFVSATISEVRQQEAKEIEIPKPQVVKEEHQDFNLNEPEIAPTDVGTRGKSNAPEPSEPNALKSDRRVSTRNRPPTVRPANVPGLSMDKRAGQLNEVNWLMIIRAKAQSSALTQNFSVLTESIRSEPSSPSSSSNHSALHFPEKSLAARILRSSSARQLANRLPVAQIQIHQEKAHKRGMLRPPKWLPKTVNDKSVSKREASHDTR